MLRRIILGAVTVLAASAAAVLASRKVWEKDIKEMNEEIQSAIEPANEPKPDVAEETAEKISEPEVPEKTTEEKVEELKQTVRELMDDEPSKKGKKEEPAPVVEKPAQSVEEVPAEEKSEEVKQNSADTAIAENKPKPRHARKSQESIRSAERQVPARHVKRGNKKKAKPAQTKEVAAKQHEQN